MKSGDVVLKDVVLICEKCGYEISLKKGEKVPLCKCQNAIFKIKR